MESFKLHLESTNATIKYTGAIEEDDIDQISLSELSDTDLDNLSMQAVGYAETLVEFEIEARYERNN